MSYVRPRPFKATFWYADAADTGWLDDLTVERPFPVPGTTGEGIFDADADEADRIMRHDPGVKAGVFSYEIHPTQTFAESRLTSASPAI